MKNLKQLLQQVFMFVKIIALVFDSRWQSLIASVPAMQTACDAFKSMVNGISEKISRYHAITRGIAEQKHAARTALNQISYSVMSSARSWAIRNADFETAAKLDITFAEARHMPYKNFMPLIENSISIVQPLVPQLAEFNVTPAIFADWTAKFTAMQDVLTGPQSAIKARKALGIQITADVKMAMEFLDGQITPLVANFQGTPEFFNAFFLNKRIGSSNVHHTRLHAHCQTELGAPVFGITVTVNAFTDPQTGKTYAADSAITDVNGNCEVSEFFPGYRTVTLSGPGIETTTFPAMQFEKGKAILQSFTVRPSFTNIP